jgi:aspartate racemase
MKTLGLIGGMSWESTVAYYRLINEGIKARLGGHHSAKMILHSVDFAEIEALQHQNQWDACADILTQAALGLERAGADCIVLCTNTMHKVAPKIQSAVAIPFLHIADATAEAIARSGIRIVALLGTRFTMEQDFYIGRLRDHHRFTMITPSAEDRTIVHRVIYDELTHGRVIDASRAAYLKIIQSLVADGAQGVILGCTEISMLVKPEMIAVPCFDTTALHADAAINLALS